MIQNFLSAKSTTETCNRQAHSYHYLQSSILFDPYTGVHCRNLMRPGANLGHPLLYVWFFIHLPYANTQTMLSANLLHKKK